jgi:hypothetical protein
VTTSAPSVRELCDLLSWLDAREVRYELIDEPFRVRAPL